jgi:hypothetical protein
VKYRYLLCYDALTVPRPALVPGRTVNVQHLQLSYGPAKTPPGMPSGDYRVLGVVLNRRDKRLWVELGA